MFSGGGVTPPQHFFGVSLYMTLSIIKKKTEYTGNMLVKTKPLYFVAIFLVYLLYFLVFFGLYNVNPVFLHHLTVFVHVFICLFLIIRFNQFVKTDISPFDKIVIMDCSILLLVNVVFSEMGINKKTIEHYLQHNVFPFFSGVKNSVIG